MRMFKKLIIVFLVLVSFANAEEFSQYITITTDVNVNGEVGLIYLNGDNSRLDYFETKLSFFPVESVNQEVKSRELNSDPDASIEDNGIIRYRWSNGGIEELKYGLTAEITSKNLFRRIDKTIAFPVSGLREEDVPYVEAREYTDINRDIRDRANELVEGEDDLYDAVFKIAEWIRTHVEYDLNTLTEKSVKKSSWVLERRQGVCDEITNLFISLLRSLKIPVKYVSGLAYSDLTESWSPHAWAEVYFPGYGWIPFDVTFGQYGWIDPGHIKMMEGFDANEPSVEYNWRAIKVGINSKEFGAKAELKEKGEKFNPLLTLDLKLLKNNVGEGSYVPIEITVENLQPYYLSSLVYVNVAPDLVGDNTKALLLKPLQEKKLYWLVNVTKELSEGLMYTGEIVVKDSFGAVSSKELNFAKGFEVVSFDEAKDLMDGLVVEEGKVRTYDLVLDCNPEKSVYYRYENMNAVCYLENKGNIPIDVNLCLKKDCKDISLNINENKQAGFVYDLSNYDERLFIRSISGKHVESSYLNFEVYDEPELEIKNIHYNPVKYSEKGEINIEVNVVPSVDKIEVEVDKIGVFDFEDVAGFRTLKIPFKAWKLEEGNNFINIKLKYYNKDKSYEIEKGFSLEIMKVGFLERLFLNFKKLIF